MELQLIKRDCDVKMRLVPYGGGWTDVYLDIGGDNLYFIISNVLGGQFGDLLYVLYHLYPDNGDPENADHIIDYKYGICEQDGENYNVVAIVDDLQEYQPPFVERDIPWKTKFTWDEEGSCSNWFLEREATEDTDFILKLHIDICRTETKSYNYEVRYKDFCYAVAKACTEVLKEYGFFGYHHSVYNQDMNLRYLLFLKSVALDNFEARKLTFFKEKGHGETTDFCKELEFLVFDM